MRECGSASQEGHEIRNSFSVELCLLVGILPFMVWHSLLDTVSGWVMKSHDLHTNNLESYLLVTLSTHPQLANLLSSFSIDTDNHMYFLKYMSSVSLCKNIYIYIFFLCSFLHKTMLCLLVT